MITNTPTTTIVFVNAQVANYQNLLKQVQPDTEFLLINADQDGIEQITNTLKNRQNITSVQIISHGGEGEIQLGRTRLNRDSIQAYREQLEQWRKALTAEADILLFGCSVGFGQGQEFLRDLSIFTGADVAASVDITGNALLGGDWDLEFATGNIESGIAISSEGQQAYAGILPLIVEYFIGNNTKEGNGVERTEVKQWSTRSTISNSAGLIREDWGTGSPPNSNVNQDNFIVRWTGYVYASSTGDYKFYENSDDGVRLWVNNRRLIEEWNKSGLDKENSASIYLEGGKWYAIQMDYFDWDASAAVNLQWQPPGSSKAYIPNNYLIPLASSTATGPNDLGYGLKGEYFNNRDLSGNPVYTQVDSAINFDWGDGSPNNKVNSNNFSVRWTGSIVIPETGSYVFSAETDDGVRLRINNSSNYDIDRWSDGSRSQDGGYIRTFSKGKVVPITLEYFENSGGAKAKLLWQAWTNDNKTNEIISKSFIPTTSLIPYTDRPNIYISSLTGASEQDGKAQFKIGTSSTIPAGGINVFYRLLPLNGASTDDFSDPNLGQLTLTPTEKEKVITINIADDDIAESNENLRIEIIPGVQYQSDSSLGVLIIDDEPIIGIENLINGSEDRGKNAEFKLVFDRQRGKEFTLKLNLEAVTNKDASDPNKYVKTTGTNTIRGNHINTTKGADYLFYWRYADHSKKEYFTGNEITVQANTGQSNKTMIIGVEPIDDDVAENTESVTVRLVQPTNGSGTENKFYQVDTQKQSATVSIEDNEPTLELVTVRNAKEYGALLSDQEDAYSIGYIELQQFDIKSSTRIAI
jgi:hypothetical protein